MDERGGEDRSLVVSAGVTAGGGAGGGGRLGSWHRVRVLRGVLARSKGREGVRERVVRLVGALSKLSQGVLGAVGGF